MKRILISIIFLALLGCGDHSFDDLTNQLLGESGTGYIVRDISHIPQDINTASFSSNASAMPSRYLFEDKFPPIASQGSYGTCTCWAIGYNLKTALNSMDNNWSASDLANPANQTSPRDLWKIIPRSGKASGCGGSVMEDAMESLISKGAASLDEVPYSGMGNDCSETSTSSGKASNKLANFRKIAVNEPLSGFSSNRIEGMTIENFKGYLSQGRPIAIGAKLGDRFDSWSSSDVLSYDTYNTPRMQHAYHAMVLSGYDDSKNAFRVRNSWGSNWGDNGSIWVDYDFFVTKFCTDAFVAQNPAAKSQDNNRPQGYDLLASFAEDFEDPKPGKCAAGPRCRGFSYEIFNNGSKTVLASQRWSVLYMYYNAYDAAKDYKIIYEDYYTDEFGSLGDFGDYAQQTEAPAGAIWNHANVAPGKYAGEAEWGNEGFYIPYEMPEITGDYYLVVFADAYEKIQETNEDNNFYFLSAENGSPLKFTDGVLQSNIVAKTSANIGGALSKKSGRVAPAQSVAELGKLNAYTPEEIKALVKRSKQNGALAKKVAEYRSGKKNIKKPRNR